MANYHITFENDQNIMPLDEEEIIKNSGFMLDHFFENSELLGKSALGYCFKPNLTIGFDLYVCDNATIQEINRDYRQKNEPTDVISFALFADCKESRIIIDNQINLGQIVISAEKIIEQTTDRLISKISRHAELVSASHDLAIPKQVRDDVNQVDNFLEEFYFLLSHGILHLLGFDHKDEESLEFMLDIQKRMCGNAALSISDRDESPRLDEESVKNVKI